jgi:cbb3-type cytochrome oxidase subunit 3
MWADGTPATGGYAIAAYILTAIFLLGYTFILFRRGAKAP